MFGLVDLAGGRVVLTQLGGDLVDDTRNRQARADAFLKPALYNALYERFRGTVLPPAEALERQIVLLGVAPKQKERARQAFQKSAIYAGFIDPAKGRFVRPGVVTPAASGETSARERPGEESRISAVPAEASVGSLTRLDPLLLALLEKIPDKQAGWPSAKRVRWFRAFAMNVSQVFDEDAENPVELSIDAAKSQDRAD
jgi:predicted transcriptional regulator